MSMQSLCDVAVDDRVKLMRDHFGWRPRTKAAAATPWPAGKFLEVNRQ